MRRGGGGDDRLTASKNIHFGNENSTVIYLCTKQ